MNNGLSDAALVAQWSEKTSGVYSTGDMENLLGDSHPVSLNRRIKRLVDAGVLRRFLRGFYLTARFDADALCMRVREPAYLSCGTVLARALAIGSVPSKTITAVTIGRNRRFVGDDISLSYLGIAPYLYFGFSSGNGIAVASPEKALLDTLYFYQKGDIPSFNIYTDIDVSGMDRRVIGGYLEKYGNPRFIAFVKGFLDERNGTD